MHNPQANMTAYLLRLYYKRIELAQRVRNNKLFGIGT